MSFISELKRRNVFRVAAAYLVGAWLLVEVSSTLEETLHLPEWADTLLAMFLLLGFPVALFFSWAFEITPDGIRRESEHFTDPASRALTARRLDWAVIVMVVIALALMAVDRWVPHQEQAASTAATRPDAIPTEEHGVPSTSEAAPVIEPLSIAVLPFVNMSSDPEQEYFSDGLTEELLNLLAGIESLKVAARTSSFYYKDKVKEIPFTEIGRQLGVAHLLEGSVRKGGDKIRVTAQLIKVEDGFHLWSATWDRTLDDIFAIQDEIAAAVVDQLKIQLLGEAPHSTVLDLESWELSLQGRYLFGRRAEGDLERALELFERAVEIDPDNALAWLGMVPLYHWLFDPPRLEDGRRAAERAVELAPENAEAWSRLTQSLWMSGDQESAGETWKKAEALGKNSPLIQGQIAGQLANQGDLDGAIEASRRAVALDPLYITNLGNLASYLTMADRLDEARHWTDRILELAPTAPSGIENLAIIHLLEGRPAEARQLIEHRQRSEINLSLGASSDAWWDALIEHSLGNRVAAEAALATFIEEEGADRPVSVACLYAWQGKPDQAFEWLDRALEKYPGISVQWSFEPWLNALEDDPRWVELMERWTGDNFVDQA